MKSEFKKNILVFNCGSSSIKYQLISMPDELPSIAGEAQRIGTRTGDKPVILHKENGIEEKIYPESMKDHAEAFREIQILLKKASSTHGMGIDLVGHRFVHGGSWFNDVTQITKKSFSKLERTYPLAPIHNPVSGRLIRECLNRMDDIPQFIVVDTAFHRTIPQAHSVYPLPRGLVSKYGIKKYGFHGISHEYVMKETADFLGSSPENLKMISCHLGTGGASLCAIRYGESLDNTMGFTPLQGLIMNTRSGDIDPVVIFYLMSVEKLSLEQANQVLNKDSGLLGLSGFTGDMRDIIKKVSGDPQCELALDMYVDRIREYIGSYYFLLKKCDVLVFTDTLGSEVPELRRRICEKLDALGLKLDQGKNDIAENRKALISTDDSEVKVMVVPTNEELMIARKIYNKTVKKENLCSI